MIFVIGYLIFCAFAGVFIARSIRHAPKDTDLWGPQAPLMDCDPETRAEILNQHPKQ